ncbi:MAG: hypothetical protein A3H64_01250 [Candidatus Ryanbacteria bacterium RIFCSPLOWO2_02_FULL_45_11c]|uniref:Glutamyl-tRNA amidotransferase n=1 Tax=Candidatus Ryanbacteria bacterium RIFCSPLOWO2_02_FULL_45_11c TaxID=1802128 RepID=A0A1G2H168_9BACT|nr:MAG: hypothetical protein A3H64_01250 [Candidatus Ryanbacteria bacterium RIFCSPLOWO2_02_FULL_45_11c]
MLKQRIESDLKEAMKQKDELRTSTLRMLLAAVQNKEISLTKKDEGLSEEEFLQVIRSEVKKRKEAAEGFEKGGRTELSEKEKKEAEILEIYLPAELSEEELNVIVKQVMRDLGASSEKDFGAVMKGVMTAVLGRAGGNRVADAVKRYLRDL